MLQQQAVSEADLYHAVWDILEDERKAIPELLPETGISVEMEQLLSSTFIQSPAYGTRCSNFLRMQQQQWHWIEKSQQGATAGQLIQKIIALQK